VYLHLPQAWDMLRRLAIRRAQVIDIDLYNHHYEIWRHRANSESNKALRIAWRYFMRRSETRIRRLADSADLVFCVSDADQASIDRREGAGISSKLFVVPNGVDVAHFQRPKDVACNSREMIFIGSLDTRRNQDAARRLRTAWPAIARRVHDAKLSVVGRNPPGWLVAKRSNNIEIVASPRDVRPYLWRAAAFLAPFETGGGTKSKVLEAIAAGAPLIATEQPFRDYPPWPVSITLKRMVRIYRPRSSWRSKTRERLSAISSAASQLVTELEWSAIARRAFDLVAGWPSACQDEGFLIISG
jgi:glycosyltransferase involved in cell wall biosynthesis